MRPAAPRILLAAWSLLAIAGIASAWAGGARRGLRARGGGRTTTRAEPEARAGWAGAPGVAARVAWPSVSVIVPAWEEAATLPRCLASLREVDYPDWEVIVVAGGEDGTFDDAAAAAEGMARWRVLRQEPLGKPTALNEGVEAAGGEIVVLLDADSVVEPDWLRALVEPLRDGVRATTGAFDPVRDTPVSRVERLARIDVYEVRRTPILQGSGSIAIERALLLELGGFAADSYADDWELDASLAARGIARGYAPDARLTTHRPATLAEYWRNEVRWRRAHLRSIARLPAHFLGTPLAAVRELYPYLLAWGTVGMTAASGAVLLGGPRRLRGAALGGWIATLAVVALRPLALVAEVVAYTGSGRWARDAWAVVATALLTLAASCVASLSMRRATLRFKGPRQAAQGAGPGPDPGRSSPASPAPAREGAPGSTPGSRSATG